MIKKFANCKYHELCYGKECGIENCKPATAPGDTTACKEE